MLATEFKLPYRALRCAQAAGARIFVLGTPPAKGLSFSRYCKAFIQARRPLDGELDPDLATEINAHVERLGIDMVMATDAHALRSLILIRDQLVAACFPTPSLETFDLLNDKARFTGLCRTLGVNCPRSRVFASPSAVNQAIEAGALELPAIIKPLRMDGGAGCFTLRGPTARDRLSRVFYRPVLVQDLIDGDDISASVYCEAGEVLASVVYAYKAGIYRTFVEPAILTEIGRITAHLKADGIYNFDIVRSRGGEVFFLECNPRMFFTMNMSMLAGLNFVAAGLPGRRQPPLSLPPRTIYFPGSILASLSRYWRMGGNVWPGMKFSLADPIPYLRERLGFEGRVRWLEHDAVNSAIGRSQASDPADPEAEIGPKAPDPAAAEAGRPPRRRPRA